jgi:hypothetical protein
MLSLNKISVIGVALSYMAIAPVSLFGQSKPKYNKNKHKSEIIMGFRIGKDLVYKNEMNANRRKRSYLSTNSIVLSVPLANHVRVESGISYNILSTLNARTGDNFLTKPNTINVPVTIQYYFLPEKQQLRPYCGIGFQYEYCLSIGNTSTQYPRDNSSNDKYQEQNCWAGTKYINILFTQGVSFEINTKIQVSGAIHFIPETAVKQIGIDLGFGYKLP